MNGKQKFDLEDRLVDFSVRCIDVSESLPNARTGSYLSGQLLRSGTAPALIYGEAQSAESRNDFVHKMKIALKELRETIICLKIIYRKKLINDGTYEALSKENDELISIFVKSIETAKKNAKR